MDVENFRLQIPATQHGVYMNTGWSGPLPIRVVQAMTQRLERESYEGPTTPHIWQERVEIGREARRAMARFINAEPEEISLAANTTTGINIVLNGLEFSPGDEVITCNLEHSSVMAPLYYLRERTGIELKILRLSAQSSAQSIADQFDQALTARTRLIVISQISYSTGLRLPLAEITRAAHARNALVLVDGAQTAGHIELDMRALDSDFYAFPGHKWLLGPDGVGGLFIRRDLIERVRPVAVAHKSVLDYDFEGHFTPNNVSIEKFELTTSNGALWAGLTEAIRLQEEIGMRQIEERTVELSSIARQQLAAIPNVRIISPAEGETTCGLVCFAITGIPAPLVASDLWERGKVVCRSVKETASTRLSLHFFNTEEEVAQTAAVVRELASEGPRLPGADAGEGFPRDV